jgi:hypothetical protein
MPRGPGKNGRGSRNAASEYAVRDGLPAPSGGGARGARNHHRQTSTSGSRGPQYPFGGAPRPLLRIEIDIDIDWQKGGAAVRQGEKAGGQDPVVE